MQIHEEAHRKAELEAAAVQRERQRAAEEAARLAVEAQQRVLSMQQIQAQQEAEAKKKYAPTSLLPTCAEYANTESSTLQAACCNAIKICFAPPHDGNNALGLQK